MNKHKSVTRQFLITGIASIIVFLFTGTSVLNAQSEEEYTIALFSPGDEANEFWAQIIDFTRAACDDLGMDFEVYYGDDDHLKVRDQIRDAAESSDPPDAMMFPNITQAGSRFLDISEEYGIPSFVFNMGLDLEEHGEPRVNYDYFIGQMTPNETEGGYELANLLLEQAENSPAYNDGTLEVIGISGRVNDGAAVLRNEGLEQAVNEHPDAELHQIVPTNWVREEAQQRFDGLNRRYDNIDIAWTASDLLSLGVLDMAPETGHEPNTDLFIGGFDWTDEALEEIENGNIVASVGGHFMEGGWVAILIYDYLNGNDFEDFGTVMHSPMVSITTDNIDEYRNLFGDENWDAIDFTNFSRTYNPGLQEYDFDYIGDSIN